MDLKNFHFLSTKTLQPKKSPHILKYKETFFSATVLLHVFEAALFLPLLERYSSFPEMTP